LGAVKYHTPSPWHDTIARAYEQAKAMPMSRGAVWIKVKFGVNMLDAYRVHRWIELSQFDQPCPVK
jgi:hypothetical protein